MGGNANSRGLLLLGAALSLFLTAAVSAETPPLRAVRFEGKLPFETSRALKFVDPKLGKPLAPEAAQKASERLRDACRRRYYPLAKVEWRVVPTAGRGQDLVFKVDAGPRGRLREIRFTGQRVFSAHDLAETLAVRPRRGFWNRWLARDVLIIDELVADQKALLQRYHQDGYATAEIGGAQLEWVRAIEGFRLTWPILNEGPVCHVGYIRLDADALPSPAVLKGILGLNAGEPFVRARVQAAIQRFESYYRSRGYAFASVQIQEDWVGDGTQVDLLVIGRPGVKPRLRSVRIRGNDVTEDRIVRREISLQPGDLFDDAALQDAQDELALLPLFSAVHMDYVGVSGLSEFDLIVDVKERKTGRFEVGVLYGEAEGAAFQMNVLEDNLSLRPPFRGEALRGNVGLTAGSEIVRVATGVRNPRVRDSHWSLDAEVSYEDSQCISDYYDQRTMGGHLLASHPLGRHNVFTTGYAATGYDVYGQDEESIQLSSVTNQDVFVTSWVLAWSLDFTDRTFRPTRGLRLNSTVALGSRALGGDTDVVQTSAGARLFASPLRDHVVSLRGGVESVDPYGDTETVALPLRTFLGGSRDLRGFDYNSVSPFDAKGRPIGGQSDWWASVEYLLPVISWLDLAVYYDVGDVALDAYEFAGDGPVSNWGIGVLIRAVEFPVRFDFATPIDTLEGDLSNEAGQMHISFSAGYRF
jgi:outer membrane protein insertion porin family